MRADRDGRERPGVSQVPNVKHLRPRSLGGRAAALASLLLLVAAAHVTSLRNGFVNFDDPLYVTRNALIQQTTLRGAARVFAEFMVGDYYPLNALSYVVDFNVWGLEPFGYHLTNLLLHLANVALVYLLVVALRFPRRSALATAVLFGVHPVTTEVVAWVSQRKTLMSVCFVLLSLLSYLRFAEGRRKRWYVASVAFCMAALLSKAAAVVIPALIMLFELCLRRERARRAALRAMPFLVVASIGAGLAIHTEHRVGVGFGTDLARVPAVFRAWTMLDALTKYAGMVLFPLHASPVYADPFLRTPWHAGVLGGVCLGLGSAYVFVRSWRERRVAAFCVGWVWVCLLPVCNLVPMPVFRANRYLYLPAIGLFAGVAAALTRALRSRWRHRGWAVVGALTLVWAGMAAVRGTRWRTSEALWRPVIRAEPRNTLALTNLAMYWLDRGEALRAEGLLRRVVERQPEDAEAHSNLAKSLLKTRNLAGALRHARRALARDPDNVLLRYNVAAVLLECGQRPEAVAHVHAALAEAEARNNEDALAQIRRGLKATGEARLALDAARALVRVDQTKGEHWVALAADFVAQGQLGRADQALAAAERAGARPGQVMYWQGTLAARRGDMGRALPLLHAAIRSEPHNAEFHRRLGVALAAGGQTGPALSAMVRATELAPGSASMHYALGTCALRCGRLPLAGRALRRAVALDPGMVRARANLAAVLRHTGKVDEAIEECRRALRLSPSYVQATNILMAALLQSGRRAQALEVYRRARTARVKVSAVFDTEFGGLAGPD